MIRLFRVHGIHCGHCVEILERSLYRTPGVRRVRIDPAGMASPAGSAGSIEVDCDPYRVSEEMLLAAMRDAGYHPRMIVAESAATAEIAIGLAAGVPEGLDDGQDGDA